MPSNDEHLNGHEDEGIQPDDGFGAPEAEAPPEPPQIVRYKALSMDEAIEAATTLREKLVKRGDDCGFRVSSRGDGSWRVVLRYGSPAAFNGIGESAD